MFDEPQHITNIRELQTLKTGPQQQNFSPFLESHSFCKWALFSYWENAVRKLDFLWKNIGLWEKTPAPLSPGPVIGI